MTGTVNAPLKIALCDDEPAFLGELSEGVERFFKGKGSPDISCFESGGELLCEMTENPADIVFLDIKMEGRDGMETARALRSNGFEGYIVFVTVLPELVYESFSVEACGYIVKPVSEDRLFETLGRICERRKKGCFTVKAGGDVVLIPFEDILFCEVLDKEIILHRVRKASEQLRFRGSISEISEKLDSGFFHCHRSFIVNLRHIESVGKGEITLKDGVRIPLSRLRRQRLLEALTDFAGDIL